MNWDNFIKIKEKAESLNISAILGVIPENRDPSLSQWSTPSDFYDILLEYKSRGDIIAQHGTYHQYVNRNPGILGISNKSEFAGLPYEVQLKKLSRGKRILCEAGLWMPVFMAPSHSFDLLTLRALSDLNFKSVTDGYGFTPYRKSGITLFPQMTSRFLKYGWGVSTNCLHVNSMQSKDVVRFNNFLDATVESDYYDLEYFYNDLATPSSSIESNVFGLAIKAIRRLL